MIDNRCRISYHEHAYVARVERAERDTEEEEEMEEETIGRRAPGGGQLCDAES